MYSLLGVALGASGVAGLYSCWRKMPLSGPLVVALSWLLVAASLWAWSQASGVEFGVSYALMGFSLVAWLVLLFNYEVRESKQARSAPSASVTVDSRSWGRHALLFVMTLPLAGAASIFSCVWLCSFLPGHTTDKMVLAVFLVPVVWGLAAYWAGADPRPARPALALLLAIAIPALSLYL